MQIHTGASFHPYVSPRQLLCKIEKEVRIGGRKLQSAFASISKRNWIGGMYWRGKKLQREFASIWYKKLIRNMYSQAKPGMDGERKGVGGRGGVPAPEL